MNNKHLKTAIRIVLFISLFLILMTYYFRVFNFKKSDGIYQMQKFYEEKDNTLDVIFLGSSHMFVNANTSVLWDEYGIASYDLGGSIQPYWNTYHYLVEAFKTQSPKAVVFDVFTAADVNTEYSSFESVVKNTYGMKLSANKIDAINASVREEDRNCYYYEYPTFHKRYLDDISKIDFMKGYEGDYYYLDCWKGETLFFDSNPLPRPADDVIFNTTVGSLTEKNEEYLRKIIDLCKEHNTPLLLVLNPYHVLEYQVPVYNRVWEIAEETGTDYINFNLLYDEIGVDFEDDFIDACHMKYSGSANFSRYMAGILKEKYDIPDRRGSAGYESFDKMVTLYKKAVRYSEIRKMDDLADVAKSLDASANVIVISVTGDYLSDKDYEKNKNSLLKYGVDLSTVAGNSVWVIDDGNPVFASGSSDNYSYRSRVSKYDTLSVVSQTMADSTSPLIRINTNAYSSDINGVKIMVYDKELQSMVADMVFTNTKEDE